MLALPRSCILTSKLPKTGHALALGMLWWQTPLQMTPCASRRSSSSAFSRNSVITAWWTSQTRQVHLRPGAYMAGVPMIIDNEHWSKWILVNARLFILWLHSHAYEFSHSNARQHTQSLSIASIPSWICLQIQEVSRLLTGRLPQ